MLAHEAPGTMFGSDSYGIAARIEVPYSTIAADMIHGAGSVARV